jgi:hypothetical protein
MGFFGWAWCGRSGAALAGLAMAAACGGGAGPTSPTPSAPAPTPAPSPTPTAAVARYEVTFDSTWDAGTHPVDFPRNPHFSPLVGATHSSRARFWMPGGPASAGIEAMAELGRTSPLDEEVRAAIAASTAYGLIQGGGIPRSPGQVSTQFEIGREQPLVSLVSMVAPSPDWFVGVDSLSLVEGGDWVAERVVTLYPWDAGTDDGATYTSPDADSQPRQPIRTLKRPPVAQGGTVAPFGTFSFRRIR